MEQLKLFDFGPPRLPFDEGRDGEPLAGLGLDDGGPQLALFAERVQLLGAMSSGLRDGNFKAALQARAALASTYGTDALPAGHAVLDRFGPGFWELRLELGARLTLWEAADANLARTAPGYRPLLRRGFYSRLLATHNAPDVVAERPACLAPCANVLRELGQSAEARLLVRDVLLGGREVSALAFEDAELADLLAEDRSPPWLVVLGALRRLWPVTWPKAEDIEELSRAPLPPDPGDDTERGLCFWRSLSVAQVQSGVTTDTLKAARRRMKRLDPVLHAAYMEGSIPR